jgi:DNA replication protein DnaC
MNAVPANLQEQLLYLRLYHLKDHYPELLARATEKTLSYHDFLAEILDAEVAYRFQKSIEYRLKNARFPVTKTLDQYQWDHPQKIHRQQILSLFRLEFIDRHANVLFLGGVGVGKTHLAIALGYQACLKAYSVLFTTAVDIVNSLAAAQHANRFAAELKKYTAPALLCIDELGYMPIDKHGADLLFQVFSQRYERGAIVLTTNRPFKDWALLFNNDSAIASAILDRLLHHSEVVVIEGPSFRMKDRLPE